MNELPILVPITVIPQLNEYSMTVTEVDENVTLGTSFTINPTIYDTPAYKGDYTVTPLEASAVVLETKDLRCTDDITVLKIPRHSTSNEYGTTFYIAEV